MRKLILAAAALAALGAAPAFAMDGAMLLNPTPASGFAGPGATRAVGISLNQGEGAQMQAVRPASGTTGTVGAKVSTGAFQFNQGFGQG